MFARFSTSNLARRENENISRLRSRTININNVKHVSRIKIKTKEKYCEMEENSGAMAAVSKQATPCDFNGLLEMNLPHIVERIFLFLDHESFVSCCEVSRIWNSILTAEPINKKAKSLFRKEILADEKQLSRLSRYGGKATDVRRILLSGLVNVNVNYMWGTWGTMTPIYSAASDGRINIVQMLKS